MNLFLLCWNLSQCAQWHFDRHVIKMILELAQQLSNAHHYLDSKEAKEFADAGNIYKSFARSDEKCELWAKQFNIPVSKRVDSNNKLMRLAYMGHPCTEWVRQHKNNYLFTARLALELCKEYTFRYSKATEDESGNRIILVPKIHKTQSKIEFMLANVPKSIDCCTNSDLVVLVGPHQVTEPAQAFIDKSCFVPGNAIEAYRKYYQSQSKQHLRKWTYRKPPYWFKDPICREKFISEKEKIALEKKLEKTTKKRKLNQSQKTTKKHKLISKNVVPKESIIV